jgi:hypothetical protein
MGRLDADSLRTMEFAAFLLRLRERIDSLDAHEAHGDLRAEWDALWYVVPEWSAIDVREANELAERVGRMTAPVSEMERTGGRDA